MANYNKVILMGNLTRDPQLSYLPSNTPVAEFGMAINRKFRGQDGNQREEVCFVDLRAYGKQAETINQYMTKGRPLLIEGRLQYQQWTTPEGQKRSRHMVIVEAFQFVGGRQEGGEGGAPRPMTRPVGGGPQRPAPPAPAQTPAAHDYGPPAEEPPAHEAWPEEPPPPQQEDVPF